MSGTCIGVWTDGDGTNHGVLAPAHGGPPLKFTQADTEDGEDGGVKTLATGTVPTSGVIGASVTYVYNGGSGVAKQVRF